MKYNNINTACTALESAVAELAQVRAELEHTADALAAANDELALVKLNAEVHKLGAEVFKEQFEEADAKLKKMELEHERNFRFLLNEFADIAWQEMMAEEKGDIIMANKCNAMKNGIEYAIGKMHQVGVIAYGNKSMHGVIVEVWGDDLPISYHHWCANDNEFVLDLKVS